MKADNRIIGTIVVTACVAWFAVGGAHARPFGAP